MKYLLTFGLAFSPSFAWGQVFSNSVPAGVVASSRPVASPGGGGGGGITIVNNATGKQRASAASLSFNTAVVPQSGELVIVVASIGGQDCTAANCVADNNGNNFTVVKRFDSGIGSAIVAYFKVPTTYGSPYTITITPDNSASIEGSALIISGQNATTPNDQTTGNTGTSNAPATGNTANTDANCGLWVASFVNDSGSNEAVTSPTGYTANIYEEEDGVNWAVGSGDYKTSSVAGVAASATWATATSHSWSAVIQTFK